MNSVKMVLVVEHGVLGFIVRDKLNGYSIVRWYLDGLQYESILEEDIEYIVKFNGEIECLEN
jgi:hypothetical protein